MWIVSKKTLREFWERHSDAKRPLLVWYKQVEYLVWETLDQVKATYASASIIANDRVVCNIKGHDYRLVAHIRYQQRKVYIRFVGTHAEYDHINAEEV